LIPAFRFEANGTHKVQFPMTNCGKQAAEPLCTGRRAGNGVNAQRVYERVRQLIQGIRHKPHGVCDQARRYFNGKYGKINKKNRP
jgi:hypothetical protein